MPSVANLQGRWQRSLIEWADGRRDTATRARWLQGIHAFVDLRQPSGVAELAHARCLNDLSLRDCAMLAHQEGFAGRLSCDGRHFEWTRHIDFQPKATLADAGSLEWSNDILVERGRDSPYVEHWHRDAAAATAPVGATLMRESGTATSAILLRVGAQFMYARDRAETLPAHARLSDCIAAAASVEAARALVDCEISHGTVAAEGFRITASTLPYKRGQLLDPRLLRNTLTLSDGAPDGTAIDRVWDIIEREGDVGELDIS